MLEGDLIQFKCIGAGKTDKPPYSQDGEWRIGIIVEKDDIDPIFMPFEVFQILYRGQVFRVPCENCKLLQEVHHESR